MPIYEYRCPHCNEVFEKIRKAAGSEVEKCTKCGKMATRLISKTSFTLKGSGWYKDGYAAAKPKDECKSCKAQCPNKAKDSKGGDSG